MDSLVLLNFRVERLRDCIHEYEIGAMTPPIYTLEEINEMKKELGYIEKYYSKG